MASDKARAIMMNVIEKNKENYKNMDYKAEQNLRNTIYEWVKTRIVSTTTTISLSSIPRENIPAFMKKF